MKIREANKRDFKEVLELVIQNTQHHIKLDKLYWKPHKISWESLVKIRETESKELKKDLVDAKTKILVAVMEKKIAGFISISFMKNPYMKVRRGEINDLFVLEDYRKKGIGKALTKKGFSLFKSKGIKIISLNASSNNIPTLKFYKNIGFKENLKRLSLKLK